MRGFLLIFRIISSASLIFEKSGFLSVIHKELVGFVFNFSLSNAATARIARQQQIFVEAQMTFGDA